MSFVEVHEEHLGRRFHRGDPVEFFEAREQPVDAQRGADAGERLLRVESGEVVVPAARADAAERGQVVEKALEHDAGVVVEPAGNGGIDGDPPVGHARIPPAGDDRGERRHAGPARFGVTNEATEPREHVAGRAPEARHLQQRHHRLRRHPVAREFGGHRLGRGLAEFVEAPQHRRRLVGESQPAEDPGQHPPIVDPDGEPLDADRGQEVVHDEHHFQVGHGAGRADRVEVALHELAVAAPLRVLPPPDGCQVIPLEWQPQFVHVLGGEPGEGHGEVEPHADVAATVILEAVELLVGLLASLAREDLEVFQRRRIDRREAVRPVDPPRDVENPFPHERLRGQVIAKSLERAWLDHKGVSHQIWAHWETW